MQQSSGTKMSGRSSVVYLFYFFFANKKKSCCFVASSLFLTHPSCAGKGTLTVHHTHAQRERERSRRYDGVKEDAGFDG